MCEAHTFTEGIQDSSYFASISPTGTDVDQISSESNDEYAGSTEILSSQSTLNTENIAVVTEVLKTRTDSRARMFRMIWTDGKWIEDVKYVAPTCETSPLPRRR